MYRIVDFEKELCLCKITYILRELTCREVFWIYRLLEDYLLTQQGFPFEYELN